VHNNNNNSIKNYCDDGDWQTKERENRARTKIIMTEVAVVVAVAAETMGSGSQ